MPTSLVLIRTMIMKVIRNQHVRTGKITTEMDRLTIPAIKVVPMNKMTTSATQTDLNVTTVRMMTMTEIPTIQTMTDAPDQMMIRN